MAQKVSVLVLDDLTGAEGAEMVRFALDGQELEIDLVPDNADSLRGTLEQYIGHGRRVGGAPVRRARNSVAAALAAPPVVSAGVSISNRRTTYGTTEVREWALAQGLPVKPKGRIPAEIYDRYHAAHA
jgi:hypothetical protein